ncbi:MAG: aldo/keto reductase [Bacteroidaceae bacterium]|nr:aldo/keto reductase [Bacteroidaceae bacterium]
MLAKRNIGNLEVSAVSLGCMGISHAYGEASSKQDVAELLAKAIEVGYTMFDTAEVYGTADNPHHNEELLGELLKPYRNQIVIATKCGITFDKSFIGKGTMPLITDGSPNAIRESIEGSLQRLQTDHIDLYYQHRVDPKVKPETVAETMAELIKEGKILHWGVSEASEEYIRRAHKVCPITAVQMRYSMMARWHEALFPILEELNIGLVAFSPLANGLLSNSYKPDSQFDAKTDYRASMPQFKKESFEKNKALFDLINQLATEKEATPSQISLAWMLCKKPWIVPIPGTRKVTRLIENAGAAAIQLSADEVKNIDKALDEMEMSDVFGGSKIVK